MRTIAKIRGTINDAQVGNMADALVLQLLDELAQKIEFLGHAKIYKRPFVQLVKDVDGNPSFIPKDEF